MQHIHFNVQMLKTCIAPLVVCMAVWGCGGGNTDYPALSYTVGGTVSGLKAGTSVRLGIVGHNNDFSKSSDGVFQFDGKLPLHGDATVNVVQQPANQTCTVLNGAISGIKADIKNVRVECKDNGFSIGGTVTGLATGKFVTLRNNAGDNLSLTANGSFQFPARAKDYKVEILTQPEGQGCNVSNGTGTATADISTVDVDCYASQAVNCPQDHVLVGISGKYGGIIDKIQLRCAPFDGTTVNTAAAIQPAESKVGGTGGTASYDFTCPAGEWATGVGGSNGKSTYPNSTATIQLSCSGGTKSDLFNTGGNFPYQYSCAAGKRANGLVVGEVTGANIYTGFMQGISCK